MIIPGFTVTIPVYSEAVSTTTETTKKIQTTLTKYCVLVHFGTAFGPNLKKLTLIFYYILLKKLK